MKTEKEVKEKIELVKDHLIELISDTKANSNHVSLGRLKVLLNTLQWVLEERKLILKMKGNKII